MEVVGKKQITNPRIKAGILSKLTFCWIFPFLWKSAKRNDISLDNIFDVLPEDRSAFSGNRLKREWEKECLKSKPKMYIAIYRAYGGVYLFTSFLMAFDELFVRVGQTYCLRMVIRSFSTEFDQTEKYLWAVSLCVLGFTHIFFLHHPVFMFYHLGMNLRIAVSSLIYQKVLKLNKSAQNQTTIGQIINLLSNDMSRFDAIFIFSPYVIIGPLQAAVFFYFLWNEIGISCLAGIGYIFLLMPIQYIMVNFFRTIRFKIAKKTDDRSKILNEIIIAIRVIKMYAWEKPFSQLVDQLRKFEVIWIRKRGYMNAFWLAFYFSSAKVIVFMTLMTYILTEDGSISAEKVFFSISMFEVLRQNMLYNIPLAAGYVGEMIVSLKRIETFLHLEEHDPSIINQTQGKEKNANTLASINMDHLSVSWTGEEMNLKDLTVDLEGDKVVMIIGAVGSGKTSFLHTLIAELKILKGGMSICGSTTYASQEPWIFPGSLKQNILFGSPFDKLKYDEILKVCALEDDLKQLPYGDNSIVGERGVSLSGGQKARVNLARSLYQESDIYLMDDPLSAVDTKVSRHIFDKCIKKYLKGKLRILVTHQLQYLSQADHIIVLNKGEVLAQGQYSELVEKGIDFVSLLASESDAEIAKRKESIIVNDEEIDEESNQSNPNSQDEKKQGGSVSGNTYWEYLTAGKSSFRLGLIIVSFILAQGLNNTLDYWLSYWTNEEERKRNDMNLNSTSKSSLFNDENLGENGDYLSESTFILVFGGLLTGFFLISKIRGFTFFNYAMRISVKLHNSMFKSIVRAPVQFYDDNPSGRIMNRFTKDLGAVDELLPMAIFDSASILLSLFGVLVIVVISNYFIIVPTVLLVAALWFIRRFFIKSSRDLKRIEALAKSPIFTYIASSFQGLTTLRALKAQNTLIDKFDILQDTHSSAWYGFIVANRWLAIWLEILANVYMVLVIGSFFIFDSKALVGNVGLALSSTLALADSFQWGMRQSAETENYMTSVERVLEYTKLQSEAPLEYPEKDKKNVSKDWPMEGVIEFNRVSLSYGESEKEVLKDLSFEIKAKEKIGIVGRTGAGKSSIIAALFRLTEPRGEIFIDQVKVNDIGLHDLRKSISIIPQDPVLFSGTIRYNLDPFNQYKDEDLWRALEDVDLKHAVPALDFKVSDAGSNFSVGQRQLVCLARAILRKNRIIVMDEATANVDPSTDSLIQQTIRSKFGDCTIITIAHRLHSVMDSDRILVLDNGYIKEYDHPHNLLQNESGGLTMMVRHTGEANIKLLYKIAADAYSKKQMSN